MLLNNENVDYLSEWPAHYYEIELSLIHISEPTRRS